MQLKKSSQFFRGTRMKRGSHMYETWQYSKGKNVCTKGIMPKEKPLISKGITIQ
jgi:hypothetical protein